MTAKKLLPGQTRFIPRMIGKLFRVYDVGNASFPYRTDELGVVVQDVSEDEAQLEADRLNKKIAPVKKQAAATGKTKTVQLEDVPAAQVDIPEIEAYTEMSEEERKAYEEGLFEDVKY